MVPFLCEGLRRIGVGETGPKVYTHITHTYSGRSARDAIDVCSEENPAVRIAPSSEITGECPAFFVTVQGFTI